MNTRLLILCALLLAPLAGASDALTAARLSFEQMLRAGAAEATKEQIGAAENDIKVAMKAGDGVGECEAMLATVYGFELTRHPWKGLWLGPRILPLYRSALQMEPDSARVHYLAGTGFMRAPEKFRDLAEAERLLLRAKSLYEQAGDETGLVKTRQKLDELSAIRNREKTE